MTIGDYIKSKLALWSVEYSDALIALELSRLNLTASETITGETNLDLFFYNVIPDILLRPTQVREGDLSITFDAESLRSYYKAIAAKLGRADLLANNSIKDISNRW